MLPSSLKDPFLPNPDLLPSPGRRAGKKYKIVSFSLNVITFFLFFLTYALFLSSDYNSEGKDGGVNKTEIREVRMECSRRIFVVSFWVCILSIAVLTSLLFCSVAFTEGMSGKKGFEEEDQEHFFSYSRKNPTFFLCVVFRVFLVVFLSSILLSGSMLNCR